MRYREILSRRNLSFRFSLFRVNAVNRDDDEIETRRAAVIGDRALDGGGGTRSRPTRVCDVAAYRKIIGGNLLPPHNIIIIGQLSAVLLITGQTKRVATFAISNTFIADIIITFLSRVARRAPGRVSE